MQLDDGNGEPDQVCVFLRRKLLGAIALLLGLARDGLGL